MNIQQQIDFTVHDREKSAKGTAFVQDNAKKLGGNCKKLVAFWQKHWYWLSDDDSKKLAGVRNITQRVSNLIHQNKVTVDIKWNDPVKKDYSLYRLKCTCHHVQGVKVVTGCYAHDSERKII